MYASMYVGKNDASPQMCWTQHVTVSLRSPQFTPDRHEDFSGCRRCLNTTTPQPRAPYAIALMPPFTLRRLW